MLWITSWLGHPEVPWPLAENKPNKLSEETAARCSALSQFTLTLALLDLHPSTSWTGFLIEALATRMAGMVGLTSCLIELTEYLSQMAGLLIQT